MKDHQRTEQLGTTRDFISIEWHIQLIQLCKFEWNQNSENQTYWGQIRLHSKFRESHPLCKFESNQNSENSLILFQHIQQPAISFQLNQSKWIKSKWRCFFFMSQHQSATDKKFTLWFIFHFFFFLVGVVVAVPLDSSRFFSVFISNLLAVVHISNSAGIFQRLNDF